MKKAIALFVFIITFIFTFIKIRGYDVYIYLKQAEFESFIKPLSKNLFSFSYPEHIYHNYSLLFSEFIEFINKFFGLNSLIFFQSLIVALSFTIIFLTISKELDRKESFNKYNFVFTLLFSLLLSVFTLRYRLLFRPHNISYLFFAINIFLLIRQPTKYYLYFLFINQLLWVNTHNGFVLGIVNFLLLLPYNDNLRKNWFKIFVVLLIGSLCSRFGLGPFIEVINPFIGETKDIFQIIKIHEWQTTDERLYFSFYGMLIFFSLFYVCYKRNFKLLPFYIFYLVISIRFVRFIDFFALVAFTITLFSINKSEIPKYKFNKFSIYTKYLALFILIWLCINDYKKNHLTPIGYGVAEFFYPQKHIEFIKKNQIKGNIFNSYPFGGYIIYHLYPDCKPIIDGRLCYPLGFIKLYADSLDDPHAFKKLLVKYDPDIFMLDYNHPQILMFLDVLKERYGMVFFDDNGLLFLKRCNRFNHLIEKFEYKYVSPQFVSGYDKQKNINITLVINELKRNIKETNASRTIIMYGNILESIGDFEGAKRKYEEVLSKNIPIGKAEAYNNYATILLNEGDDERAMDFFKKSLSFDSEFPIAHLNLGLIYNEKGKNFLAWYHLKKYLKSLDEEKPKDIVEKILVLEKRVIIDLVQYIIILLAFLGICIIILRKRSHNIT